MSEEKRLEIEIGWYKVVSGILSMIRLLCCIPERSEGSSTDCTNS